MKNHEKLMAAILVLDVVMSAVNSVAAFLAHSPALGGWVSSSLGWGIALMLYVSPRESPKETL